MRARCAMLAEGVGSVARDAVAAGRSGAAGTAVPAAAENGSRVAAADPTDSAIAEQPGIAADSADTACRAAPVLAAPAPPAPPLSNNQPPLPTKPPAPPAHTTQRQPTRSPKAILERCCLRTDRLILHRVRIEHRRTAAEISSPEWLIASSLGLRQPH